MTSTAVVAPTVITCHINADWDALAALIGASLLYPESVLVFPGSMERIITRFYTDTLAEAYPFAAIRDIDPNGVQQVVVVDTCQRGRVPHVAAFLDKPGVTVHIWDHHPMGSECMLATEHHHGHTGSTCTLIAHELRQRGISLSARDATFIGLGIYGDTGAFTYSSTTAQDYLAAAWLLECGMDVTSIAQMVQQDLTSTHVKLLNDLLESATNHEVGTITVTMAEAQMDSFVGDFAHVVQRFMEMESSQVLFALGIMDDKIQLVARSRAEAVDVGAVCKALGGGGHRYAASASIKIMPLPELRDAIFQQLYAQINPHRRAVDLMSAPAVGIEDKQSLHDAETVMNRYGLKAAPVFRVGTRQCVGFMEAQTASRAVAHGLGKLPVHIYMQRNPQTVAPDASLQTLMDIIVGARQRLVPVVVGGEVQGVVTRTDLIRMFVEDQGRLPLPKADDTRERNLSKLLKSRLSGSLLHLLHTAGELGDTMGVCVYAVGGFVRDVLLARPSAELDDVDLVVEGDGLSFATALAEALGGRVRAHRTFLTALVLYPDEHGEEQRVDVATARLEYYLYPAALPTVELSSIKMDLFRRDFTINAMALRVNTEKFGHLVDFFGGQNDIQRKTMRVLHALSFVEDPTRIIRAVRFAQRYGFRLGGQTSRLISNALDLHLVDKLSGARIMHELTSICGEKMPLACLDHLQRMGILAAIHPCFELTPARQEILRKLEVVLDWYRLLYLQEELHVPTLYLLGLSSNLSQPDMQAVLDRLSLPVAQKQQFNKLRESIRTILPTLNLWQKNNGPVSELCLLLAQLPIEGAIYLMARAPSEESNKSISLYINRWRQVRTDITGADLQALGLEPGPVYGKILRAVWGAKLDGKVESREEQLNFAVKLAVSGSRAHSG